MKRLALLVFLFVSFHTYAQSQAIIDSINNIPYDSKVQQANKLTDVYLKNAKNAQKIGYDLGQANSYSNLALIYYYQGKYSLNVNYSLKAIKLYESLNNQEKIASEYGSLGYSMKRRDMPQAQYYLQKALRIAESNNFITPLLSIYNNYGVLKEMQNQLDSALLFYQKGLSLKVKIQDTIGIPYSLNNIGGIHLMRGEFDKAIPFFNQALALRQLRKDSIGIAENYTLFGDLFTAKKQHIDAIKWYQKSLNIALKHDYLFLAQNNYKQISENYEQLNDKSAAFDNFKKHTALNDSLINQQTNDKIAELQIQFETAKKEKEIAESRVKAKQQKFLLIGILVILTFTVVTATLIYRQQKSKNLQLKQEHQLRTAILQIETQNQLQEQRLNISRDLHDNIGAQLTFIISSVDNLKYAFAIKNADLERRLQNISSFSRDTIVELRDTIWAMNSQSISVNDLNLRILNYLEKAQYAKESVEFKFASAPEISERELTSVEGMNLYRIIQESINNALKYADPSRIEIAFNNVYGNLEIVVSDNGKGFDQTSIQFGNGIRNMKKRAADIQAEIDINSTTAGTKVIVNLSNKTL